MLSSCANCFLILTCFLYNQDGRDFCKVANSISAEDALRLAAKCPSSSFLLTGNIRVAPNTPSDTRQRPV